MIFCNNEFLFIPRPICKNKKCQNPEPCKEKPCPCVKKIKEVQDDLKNVKADVAKNKETIDRNYNTLSEAIGDLAAQHAQDYRYTINYIDEKDAENDRQLAEETLRAINKENQLDNKIAEESNRAQNAEQQLNNKIEAETARATLSEASILSDLNQYKDSNNAALERERQSRIEGDLTLQRNINTLQQMHQQDIREMNNHLEDILGIDAAGVSEIKAILSDDNTTTGLLSELATKAKNADLLSEISRSISKDNSHDAAIQTLLDNKANKNNTTAGTYTKLTVNSEGIVTSGSNPSTLAEAGITNAYTKLEVDALISNLTALINTLKGYWIVNSNTNRLESPYVIEPFGYR